MLNVFFAGRSNFFSLVSIIVISTSACFFYYCTINIKEKNNHIFDNEITSLMIVNDIKVIINKIRSQDLLLFGGINYIHTKKKRELLISLLNEKVNTYDKYHKNSINIKYFCRLKVEIEKYNNDISYDINNLNLSTSRIYIINETLEELIRIHEVKIIEHRPYVNSYFDNVTYFIVTLLSFFLIGSLLPKAALLYKAQNEPQS